jgi:hypothetical protein
MPVSEGVKHCENSGGFDTNIKQSHAHVVQLMCAQGKDRSGAPQDRFEGITEKQVNLQHAHKGQDPKNGRHKIGGHQVDGFVPPLVERHKPRLFIKGGDSPGSSW